MTPPRPGSRAEQRRRTEARILDAATRAFLTAGYDRTTIRAVASAAGVDAGLVMHYFGSKQQLYRRGIDAPPVPPARRTPPPATQPRPPPTRAGGHRPRPPPAGAAALRAATTSAIPLGITAPRHPTRSDDLATAAPAQVIRLLRPCVLSLAARPDPSGPP